MKKITLLVINAYIVSMNACRSVWADAWLAVEKDRIAAAGPMDQLRAAGWDARDPAASFVLNAQDSEAALDLTGAKVIDAKGKAVFPGFIDSHMHMFQTIVKGLGRDKTLLDWLDASVRPTLYRMDPELVYHTALVGCIESIRSGCTTILDYMYAHAQPGTDEAVLKAMDEIGIRGILGRGCADTRPIAEKYHIDYYETEEQFFDIVVGLQEKLKGHSRLSVAMAPGFVLDFSKDAFVEMRRVADQTGIKMTMHLLETDDDDQFSLANYGKTTTEFLEDLGVLGPDFLAVHTVVARDEDIDRFVKYDVKISHNPASNLILASGIAPIAKMRKRGLSVSLACDGAGSSDSQNMLEALKLSALLQKGSLRDPSVIPASEALEMATCLGAKCVWMEDETGSLEAGKKADFFLYDPLRPTSVPVYDPVSSLVYCSTPDCVQTVVIDGEVVMEDRVITKIDEQKIIRETQEIAQGLVKDLGLGNDQWGERMPAFDGLR